MRYSLYSEQDEESMSHCLSAESSAPSQRPGSSSWNSSWSCATSVPSTCRYTRYGRQDSSTTV